ncbi:Protein of unknown function DUF89 [Geosmithia morbida]|uniref:Sugar phosphate phosphatase n=1 Tax=Geosmithia morbida TaxID=1094350 RepID=A0A9P4YTQ2_9HYPO|nr:Protein of unknown function DUF89 [Geosmithia morbida]KAF4121885.1 Protein of unknown function DUF89 [Geosmithia morbida]
MEYDNKIPKSMTSDKTSFAHETVLIRFPHILTGCIDDIHKAISKITDETEKAEGKKILEELVKFKYEVQHDRTLTPITDKLYPQEAEVFNKELEQRGNPHWLDVYWLFSECYLYRRVVTFFHNSPSKFWQEYDVFAVQKIDTFRTSRVAVLELAARYRELVEEIKANKDATHDPEAEKILFNEMFEVCLWGNATDLTLLANMSYEEIKNMQGSEARKRAEKNIVLNDLPRVYDLLAKARAEGKAERRVDFVLDNAGFELYVDLVLAGFLLSTGLATHIVFRPKSMPWFVSDVTPRDFKDTLDVISNAKTFFETPSDDDKLQGKTPAPLSAEEAANMEFVFKNWTQHHVEGEFVLRPHRYWTTGGSFWRLPHQAPDLYEDLKDAELVIFKGDLNYRKLTGDALWDPTTPYPDAIGPMGRNSGINVMSLRTCKADVVTGLKPGQDEELKKIAGDIETGARKWAWHGKWAVIALSEGKKQE